MGTWLGRQPGSQCEKREGQRPLLEVRAVSFHANQAGHSDSGRRQPWQSSRIKCVTLSTKSTLLESPRETGTRTSQQQSPDSFLKPRIQLAATSLFMLEFSLKASQ